MISSVLLLCCLASWWKYLHDGNWVRCVPNILITPISRHQLHCGVEISQKLLRTAPPALHLMITENIRPLHCFHRFEFPRSYQALAWCWCGNAGGSIKGDSRKTKFVGWWVEPLLARTSTQLYPFHFIAIIKTILIILLYSFICVLSSWNNGKEVPR